MPRPSNSRLRLAFQSYLKDGAGWSAKSIDVNLATVNSWEKFAKCQEFHSLPPGVFIVFNGIFAGCI